MRIYNRAKIEYDREFFEQCSRQYASRIHHIVIRNRLKTDSLDTAALIQPAKIKNKISDILYEVIIIVSDTDNIDSLNYKMQHEIAHLWDVEDLCDYVAAHEAKKRKRQRVISLKRQGEVNARPHVLNRSTDTEHTD